MKNIIQITSIFLISLILISCSNKTNNDYPIKPITNLSFTDYKLSLAKDSSVEIVIPIISHTPNRTFNLLKNANFEYVSYDGSNLDCIDFELKNNNLDSFISSTHANLESDYSHATLTFKLTLNEELDDEKAIINKINIIISEKSYAIPVNIEISKRNILTDVNFPDFSTRNAEFIDKQHIEFIIPKSDQYNRLVSFNIMNEDIEIASYKYSYLNNLEDPYELFNLQYTSWDGINPLLIIDKHLVVIVKLEDKNNLYLKPYLSSNIEIELADDENSYYTNGNVILRTTNNLFDMIREFENK